MNDEISSKFGEGAGAESLTPKQPFTSRQKGGPIVQLAELPTQALLDVTNLAEILRVSRRTVQRMANKNEIPRPVRQAGRSIWMAGRVLAHIEAESIKREEEARKDFARLRR